MHEVKSVSQKSIHGVRAINLRSGGGGGNF